MKPYSLYHLSIRDIKISTAVKKRRASDWHIQILRWGLAGILVLAPFYAALSIWLASLGLHHLDFIKIWKEVALAGLGLVLVSFLVTRKQYMKIVWRNRLFQVIGAYILLLVAYGIYDIASGRVADKAVIYGWLTDIRPVGVFVVAALTFAVSQQIKFPDFPWKKLLLLPAMVVIVFGFLQMTVLPKDILRHVGYSASTTVPYETVDNQPNLVRIQSTLRGPNPYGAYIAIIITALSAMIIADRGRKRLAWTLFLGLSLFVLYGTYSRSAELAVVASVIALLLLEKRRYVKTHLLAVLCACIIATILGVVAVSHHNYLAQNIVLHYSSSSTSKMSSNSQRAQAIKTAAIDVVHHPFGSGVGSAGPASRRNTKGPIKIAENYYLQIGQEIGIVGMGLFIAISLMIAYELWMQRQNQLAKILLASLVGMTVVNMVSHGWTDDTLAYVWWTLAGLVCAPVILKANKRKYNEKIAKKPA